MTRINLRRVILGGLVAGLVANAFDFVITSYILDADLQHMATRLKLTPADAWRSALVVFIGSDFVWGLLIVFTYAAIRPRFGPGPMTAIISGGIPWAAIALLTLQLSAAGMTWPTFPSWTKAAGLYLMSAVASGLVGAALYKEV